MALALLRGGKHQTEQYQTRTDVQHSDVRAAFKIEPVGSKRFLFLTVMHFKNKLAIHM